MATEKRLIYLDEAIARIKDDGILGSGYSNDERIDDVCDMLECCHTVDAVEVVHGRWEPEWMPTGVECAGHAEMTVQALSCSVCGKCVDVSESYFSYCPNCGAKMDGDGNG